MGRALIFFTYLGVVFGEGSKNIKRDWEGCRKKFDDSNENVFDPLLLPPPPNTHLIKNDSSLSWKILDKSEKYKKNNVVPKRATFEYSYSNSSIRRKPKNRAKQ